MRTCRRRWGETPFARGAGEGVMRSMTDEGLGALVPRRVAPPLIRPASPATFSPLRGAKGRIRTLRRKHVSIQLLDPHPADLPHRAVQLVAQNLERPARAAKAGGGDAAKDRAGAEDESCPRPQPHRES